MMLNALVFLCFMAPNGPVQCVVGKDETGPFETQVQCEERVDEMMAQISAKAAEHNVKIVKMKGECRLTEDRES